MFLTPIHEPTVLSFEFTQKQTAIGTLSNVCELLHSEHRSVHAKDEPGLQTGGYAAFGIE